jgi:hypothetical protein
MDSTHIPDIFATHTEQILATSAYSWMTRIPGL